MSFFAMFTKAKAKKKSIDLTELEREALECFILDEESVQRIDAVTRNSKFYMYRNARGAWLLIESMYEPLKGVSDV